VNVETSPHENRVQGSKSYFVRLQIAHTFEALKVIYRLKNKPAFMAKVEQCDRATNAAFNRLVAVIGTEEYQKMKRLRNAITFHYETQAIQDAINRQSAKFPDYAMPLSTGSTTLDWYFEPGDRIVDSVIRNHWGRPPDRIEALDGGLSNYVFAADVGGKSYIVRFSPSAEKIESYLKEKWAIEKAGDGDVWVRERCS